MSYQDEALGYRPRAPVGLCLLAGLGSVLLDKLEKVARRMEVWVSKWKRMDG